MADTAEVRLHHPNRERASAKATKAVITILLLASAGLIAIVLLGGWTAQAGARWMTAGFVIIYAVIAYYVFFQWKRGVLAMAAGLALIFACFTAPGLPGWFERTKDGYETPLLPAEVLGLLAILTVVVQLLLAVAAVVGFQQGWNLEVEEHADEGYDDYDDQDGYGDDGHYDHDPDGHGEQDHEEPDYGDRETTEQEAVPAGAGGGSTQAEATSHGDDGGETESGAPAPTWMERHRAAASEEEAGDGSEPPR